MNYKGLKIQGIKNKASFNCQTDKNAFIEKKYVFIVLLKL